MALVARCVQQILAYMLNCGKKKNMKNIQNICFSNNQLVLLLTLN